MISILNKYWFRHSLPVILILYNPEEDLCYWESISEDTIINTGRGRKVTVPTKKRLMKESLAELRKITQPPEHPACGSARGVSQNLTDRSRIMNVHP